MGLQLCFCLSGGEGGNIEVGKTKKTHHPNKGDGEEGFEEGEAFTSHDRN